MGQFVYTPPPSRVAIQDVPGAPERFGFVAHVIHVATFVLSFYWLWTFLWMVIYYFFTLRQIATVTKYADINLYLPFWKHISFGIVGRYLNFFTQPAFMIWWRVALATILLVLCALFWKKTKAAFPSAVLAFYTIAVVALHAAADVRTYVMSVFIGLVVAVFALNGYRRARKFITAFYFGA